jgi:hypothetical protein
MAPWPLQNKFILRPPISTSWCGFAKASLSAFCVNGAANREAGAPQTNASIAISVKPLRIE